MTAIELQDFIFSEKLTRRKLLDYNPKADKNYRVQIFRNHSFELVEHTISAYLDFANIGVEFIYSAYDDSLSFLELEPEVDAVIIWIDANRYNIDDFQAFLIKRLEYLRQSYKKEVLLVPFGEECSIASNLATVFSLKGIQEKLGDKFTDERVASVTGTSLSNHAMLLISQDLGLKYLPALLKPSLKAVVVDLDNTMYHGVLGEDGIANLIITKEHIELHKALKKLADQGIFVCISSKNELEDVEQLFVKRSDFAIKRSDFTKICVSWKPKAEAIADIAQYLNIGIDSIVMMDDNIGELNAMCMSYPQLHIIHAKEDAGISLNVLNNYPGLFLLNSGKEANLRKDDVIANEKRRSIQAQITNKEDYIKSLKIKLIYDLHNEGKLKRIAELANKTNQFIFNYKRYTLQQLELMEESEDYAIVSVSLEDCLSDSGLIAACVGKKEKDVTVVEEVFMSCRALGRGIDDIIVMGAISLLAQKLGTDKIKVLFRDGERNRPAKEYLNQYLHDYTNQGKTFAFEFPEDLLSITIN